MIETMSIRRYFEGQAMANPIICSGTASAHDIDRWFGKNASNISREQIAAAQASAFAEAMMVGYRV